MRGSKERKVIIGAVIVTLILVTLFVVLQVPRRVKLLFPTEKTIEQDVKKYLKKRYKQDFHVTNIIPPSYEYASYIITVYPYGKPMDEEHKATVQGWEKDGLITYYDNYALVKLIPEYEEYVSEIVKEFFSKNKVYIRGFNLEWNTYEVNPDLSLNQFLNLKDSPWRSTVDIQIIVSESSGEYKEQMYNVIQKLDEQGIYGSVIISNVFENKLYNKINKKVYFDYLADYMGVGCSAFLSPSKGILGYKVKEHIR